MEQASVNPSRRPWQRMRLHYVGRIGDLMQGGTFSRIEPGNAGRDKGVGGG
jgi:hypothetical protein